MLAVIVAYLWMDFGFNLVIIIAGMQCIPKEFREAAEIDGAGSWQILRHVTVPLLRPTLLFVCVMTMISSFQVFDIIQVMTNGGPNNQTRVLELDIYENAFRYQSMGWAAAVSLVLLVVVMVITLAQMRFCCPSSGWFFRLSRRVRR
jgi:multiple sugar transport system permease protein